MCFVMGYVVGVRLTPTTAMRLRWLSLAILTMFDLRRKGLKKKSRNETNLPVSGDGDLIP